jgi:hypothetical protein
MSALPCDYLYYIHIVDVDGVLLQKHVAFVLSYVTVLPYTLLTLCLYKAISTRNTLITYPYYPEAPLGWSDAEEGVSR